jgi:hypothetical protein
VNIQIAALQHALRVRQIDDSPAVADREEQKIQVGDDVYKPEITR